MADLARKLYDYEQYEQEQQRRVRGKPKKKTKPFPKEGIRVTLGLIVTTVMSFTLIYNYSVITTKQMELTTLKDEIIDLENKVDSYTVYLETFANSSNVQPIAQSYFGLSTASGDSLVYIDMSSYDSTLIEEPTVVDKVVEVLIGLKDKAAETVDNAVTTVEQGAKLIARIE